MSSSRDPIDSTPKGALLREAKVALRRKVLAARDALPIEARTAATPAIVAGIVSLPSFNVAPVVLLTLAFRSEWDTTPLIRAALDAGKRVAAPRVNPSTRMLDLHGVSDLARDVRPGHVGIPEPLPTCLSIAPAAVEWVLVPGVAFDIEGRRLGYGGGYYDRLLPLLPRGTPRVVGAFDMQIVERVPAAPHDLGVDTIVTESRTIQIAR
jgi:5-formyltetrahydrofolate cyclo-ligase